jgi:hypothetical protein
MKHQPGIDAIKTRPALGAIPKITPPRQVRPDVNLYLPEALYDNLTRQARTDSRAVSEYIRVVLERHLCGTRSAGLCPRQSSPW